MNKEVKKLLAGLLTGTVVVTTGYAIGESLVASGKDHNYFRELFRPATQNRLDPDTELTPESVLNNNVQFENDGSDDSIETLPQVDPNLPVEKPNNMPSYPIENGPTLTGNSNTQNDKFVAGQVCINNSNFVLPEDVSYNLNTAISEIEKMGVSVGFYLTDPETNMTISYNGNKDFQPASTVKAGMVLYAVKQIEQGNASFDDKMKYESKHYCGGSGSIQYFDYGTEFSLKDILHYTINISDNIGYYMLLDKFGHEGYNEMITDLGCKTWLNGWTKWGYLTPQELNLIWQEIYAYSKSSEEGAWLFNEFLNAEYNFVKKCLPEYESAHKSGFNPNGYHDSAVVFGDRPYIMTIMTTQSWWTHENMDKIAEALDDAMKAYNNYLSNQNTYDMGN